MRLTQTHFLFWSQCHSPKWANQLQKMHRVTIDDCINSHAGDPRIDTETHNTLQLIRMYRRQDYELRERLVYLAKSGSSSKKRKAMCRRWLAKMNRNSRWLTY